MTINSIDPHYLLFGSIKIYNSRKGDCVISKELKISKDRSVKETDAKVVSTFFRQLELTVHSKGQTGFRAIPIHEWQEIKLELFTFIENSKELKAHEREAFVGQLVTQVQSRIDLLNPIDAAKRLVQLYEVSGKLDVAALRALEKALELLAVERIGMQMVLLVHFAELQKGLFLEAFESLGGRVKESRENRYAIDWEQLPKFTPEEFAISAILERAHSERQGNFKPKLAELLEEVTDFEPSKQLVLKRWSLFLAVCEMGHLVDLLVGMIVQKTALFTDEYPFLSEHAQAVVNYLVDERSDAGFSKVFLDMTIAQRRASLEKEHAKLLGLVSLYLESLTSMNGLYERLYRTYETVKAKEKGYVSKSTSGLLDSRLPTVQEFSQIHIPSLSFSECSEKMAKSIAAELSSFALEKESFALCHLLKFAIGTDDPVGPFDLVRLFCRELNIRPPANRKKSPPHSCSMPDENESEKSELTTKMAHLTLTPSAQASSSKKSRHRHNRQRTLAPINSEQVATQTSEGITPAVVMKREALSPISIDERLALFVDPRVRDWISPEPQAFSQLPYSQLTPESRALSKFLHSYPTLITRCLMAYTRAEKWPAKLAGTFHDLYSAPGVIEKEGITYEGRFTDCFDKNRILYHHFFQLKPLKQQLLPDVSKVDLAKLQEEMQDRVQDDTKDQRLIEQEQERRYQLKRTPPTIEVHDLVENVRYTLCLLT